MITEHIRIARPHFRDMTNILVPLSWSCLRPRPAPVTPRPCIEP